MICIYHSRDLDGHTSGAICKRKYPDAILVGFDYGQDVYEKLERAGIKADDLFGHHVIMIDVSMKMPQMFELAKKCKTLTYIDHHISAINEFKALNDIPPNFIAVLENGIAACEVGWKYLFPNEKMPKAVELLGQYDTWRNQDKNRWENEILPFQFGMRLFCNSPQTFPMDLLEPEEANDYSGPKLRYRALSKIEKIIETGNIILEYQAMQNQAACRASFEFEFEGLRAICLNGGGFNSDVFKSVYDPDKHDIMMPFKFDGKTKQWIFSMYSTKPDVDVSVIAKKWGGGGHFSAAGFQVRDIGLIFTFLNQKNATEINIKQLPNGQISCEMEGNDGDIAQMLCRAMIGNVDFAAMLCGAIPTYLDESKIDRMGFCRELMNAQGSRTP